MNFNVRLARLEEALAPPDAGPVFCVLEIEAGGATIHPIPPGPADDRAKQCLTAVPLDVLAECQNDGRLIRIGRLEPGMWDALGSVSAERLQYSPERLRQLCAGLLMV